MKRRSFIKNSSKAALAFCISTNTHFSELPPYVLGHGDHKYAIKRDWGKLNPTYYPIKDCMAMAEDSMGRLLLLTNETRNNILIYSKSGKIQDRWGRNFPGAYGLCLNKEGSEDFIYITDIQRHQIYKLSTLGQLIQTIDYPSDGGNYFSVEEYLPTSIAVAENGDIYVADGLGHQWISVFGQDGKLKFQFGGREKFKAATGITVDRRNPEKPILLIADRDQQTLFKYGMDGSYIDEIKFPGAYINRAVIKGKEVYLSVLKAASFPNSGSGFIMILNEFNQPISCPGGSEPAIGRDGNYQEFHQTVKLFKHPSDVCIDAAGNLYVPQWNSGQVYPIKLERL